MPQSILANRQTGFIPVMQAWFMVLWRLGKLQDTRSLPKICWRRCKWLPSVVLNWMVFWCFLLLCHLLRSYTLALVKVKERIFVKSKKQFKVTKLAIKIHKDCRRSSCIVLLYPWSPWMFFDFPGSHKAVCDPAAAWQAQGFPSSCVKPRLWGHILSLQNPERGNRTLTFLRYFLETYIILYKYYAATIRIHLLCIYIYIYIVRYCKYFFVVLQHIYKSTHKYALYSPPADWEQNQECMEGFVYHICIHKSKSFKLN